MRGVRIDGWKGLAWLVGALGLLFLLGAALFVWSGVYNVAASKPHFAITTWLLHTTLRQSVETHSTDLKTPDLDDPDLVRLGAGHFASGCAPCHGTPGEPQNPIVKRMLPVPPPLTQAAREWPPDELHWIVKNGFKYTGMPAWVTQERGDEVWPLVAFLAQLPRMGPQEYAELASGNARRTEGEAASERLTQCSRCHDTGEAPVTSSLVPRLAGQNAAYLERALREYAEGKRQSGIMQPVAAELAVGDMGRIARNYAGLAPAETPPADPADAEKIAHGRRIATQGVPERGIPACLACHSGRASEQFPLLHGQPADYIAGQLHLFQQGVRARTSYGAIMAAVAQRLTEADISDLSAFFASLPADGGASAERTSAAGEAQR